MYANLNGNQSDICKTRCAERSGFFESVLTRGYTPNVGTTASTTNIDIYPPGGSYPFLSTAEQLDINSTDTNDTALGTGLRVVSIEGLDSDWNKVTEIVSLNGTTDVRTTNSFIRINNVFGLSVGTNYYNIGTVKLKSSSTPANILAQIDPKIGLSLSSIYSFPRNTSDVMLLNSSVSMQRKLGAYIVVQLDIRKTFEDGSISPWQSRIIFSSTGSAPSDLKFDRHILSGASKVDIKYRATDASDNNIQVFTSLEFKRFIKG